MSASSRAAHALIRQEGRPPEMKLAAIALAVACLLAGLRQLDPHPAVVARGQPGGPRRGLARPSRLRPAPVTRRRPLRPRHSRHPPPTLMRFGRSPRPGTWQHPTPTAGPSRRSSRSPRGPTTTEADIWGQFAADLKKLQVPADTAADLHDLIRKVTKVQALNIEASGHFARMADFYAVARHRRNAQSRMSDAIDRVRSDLDLPALCRAGCP